MRIRVITAALAVLAGASLVACDPAEPTGQGAAVMCEKFVKERLKSPGTADFSGVSDTQIKTISGSKPWRYLVTGYVDSQNGFGATVRNTYTCDVSTKDNDTWSLTRDVDLKQR
ncbi:hypothetical protein [Streptomyces sp. NPDC088727]|uniref:hypothetical protein n=1 Tax=Streptomyces sp. NPDC088727 TaxID=3365875 RepID=UPI0037FC9DBD